MKLSLFFAQDYFLCLDSQLGTVQFFCIVESLLSYKFLLYQAQRKEGNSDRLKMKNKSKGARTTTTGKAIFFQIFRLSFPQNFNGLFFSAESACTNQCNCMTRLLIGNCTKLLFSQKILHTCTTRYYTRVYTVCSEYFST